MDSLAAVWNAIVGAISRGKLEIAQRGKQRTLLQMQMLNGETKTAELILPYGMSAVPAAGGDVITFTVGATRDHVVAIGVDDPSLRIRDLGSGEFGLTNGSMRIVFRQNRLEISGSQPLQIITDGDVTSISKNFTATATGTMTMNVGGGTGTLQVNGNLVASQNISDQNGAHGTLGQLRSDYDIHTHQVPNVVRGGDTITTTGPTPTL